MANFRENIDLFEVTDRNHATVFNEVLEQIIGNTINNKERLDLLPDDFAAVYTKFEEYTTTEDLNELLQHGVKGDKGDVGVGLNYNWNGTELGVKREDEVDYTYVDLRGPSGSGGLERDEIEVMINQAVDGIIVPSKVSQLENDENFLKDTDLSDWVKATDKPKYTASEVGALASDGFAIGTVSSTAGGRNYDTTADLPIKGDGKVRHLLSTSKMTEGKPSKDGYITHWAWDNNAGYEAELFISNNSDNVMQHRGMTKGAWGDWFTIYDSNNFAPVANLTSTSTTTPLAANQGKVLNDAINDLKTISVDGKQKVADAINGKLGTTLSSTTSYKDLAYYITTLCNAMNSSTPTAKFVYGTTTKTMTVTSLVLQTYNNAIDTCTITANSGELSGTVTNYIFSTVDCTADIVDLSGTSYKITTSGILYIVQFKKRTNITLTSKNGVLSAIGY